LRTPLAAVVSQAGLGLESRTRDATSLQRDPNRRAAQQFHSGFPENEAPVCGLHDRAVFADVTNHHRCHERPGGSHCAVIAVAEALR